MPGLVIPRSRLIEQVREVMRVKHYSIRAVEADRDSIKRFILFQNKRYPRELGSPEVAAFLDHLAVNRRVSASTQSQALNALVSLYRQVLHLDLGDLGEVMRAKRPRRLPVVLSRDEVRRVIVGLPGTFRRMGELLYGIGIRLMECVRPRVKTVDFERNPILVRDATGAKDRVTMLPAAVQETLRQHFERVRLLHRSKTSGTGVAMCICQMRPNAGTVTMPDPWRRESFGAACRIRAEDENPPMIIAEILEVPGNQVTPELPHLPKRSPSVVPATADRCE